MYSSIVVPERRPLYLAPNEMAARLGDVPCLNGLRAVSIIIVLLAHYVDENFFPGGFGVYIFFVISGFLITRLLFAELKRNHKISISHFYARRFLRIYPVISIYATIVLSAYLLLSPTKINYLEPISALFYFANYLYAHYSVVGRPEGHMPFVLFWSLSVEEHFYLLFPVVFALTARRPSRLIIILASVIIGCLLIRTVVATLMPELLGTLHFFFRSEYRLDSVAFGVLLAVACETKWGRDLLIELARPTFLIFALTVLLFCFLYRDLWFRDTLRYSLQGIALAVAFTAVLFTDRYKIVNIFLNLPIISWVGKISYSLYVWHVSISYISESMLPSTARGERILFNFLISFVVAAGSYYVIERPFVNLRHRFGSRSVG